MNRKQAITLWVMVVALTVSSFLHGLEEEGIFFLLAVPILLIGTTLVFHFEIGQSTGPTRMHRRVAYSCFSFLPASKLGLRAS